MSVRIGVIGTGGIGQGHIKLIMNKLPEARVVAVNDINMEVCEKVAAEYGARAFKDPHDLIKSAIVDAVLIASWDQTHEDYCIAAIKAAKPVFCEKPLSNTSKGCRNIMEAEIAGGKRLLFVGFMRRFDSGYRELRDAVAKDKLGAPLIVHCKHRNMHPTGAKHTSDMSVSGALVHEFDVVRYLIGEDDPYVSAQVVCPRSSKYADRELIDPQLVYLETQNGVRVNLEIFMNCHYGYDIQCEIVGEEGTACLPDPSHIHIRMNGTKIQPIDKFWFERFPEAYEVELREWIENIRSGSFTGPTAWDGYVTARVAEACIESRKQKNVIHFDLGIRPEFYKK